MLLRGTSSLIRHCGIILDLLPLHLPQPELEHQEDWGVGGRGKGQQNAAFGGKA